MLDLPSIMLSIELFEHFPALTPQLVFELPVILVGEFLKDVEAHLVRGILISLQGGSRQDGGL